MKTMEIRIPFQGFYESIYTHYFDSELEDEDSGIEEDNINWLETYKNTAKVFAEEWLNEMDYEGKFTKLVSPREYNFDTDAVYVELTEDSLSKIKASVSVPEGEFAAWVAENCCDRPGFISFLSPRLHDWPLEWTEREYMAALEFLYSEGEWDEELIVERLYSNGQMEVIENETDSN